MITPKYSRKVMLQPKAATYNWRYLQCRYFNGYGIRLSKRRIRRELGRLKRQGHYRRNKVFGPLPKVEQ
jgi:hypothetical protein